MRPDDVATVVGLQRLAFPPPFAEELHWDSMHIDRHLELFADGQFVAEMDGMVVGSCSNALIAEERWLRHSSWGETVGGPFIQAHDPNGTTLYGLDITVHPEYRRLGIGRSFYEARFNYVRANGLTRYGTGCRIPGYRSYATAHAKPDVEAYVKGVVDGREVDRTLTPLLRYEVVCLGVVRNYMPDEESANAAALLEWRP